MYRKKNWLDRWICEQILSYVKLEKSSSEEFLVSFCEDEMSILFLKSPIEQDVKSKVDV